MIHKILAMKLSLTRVQKCNFHHRMNSVYFVYFVFRKIVELTKYKHNIIQHKILVMKLAWQDRGVKLMNKWIHNILGEILKNTTDQIFILLNCLKLG